MLPSAPPKSCPCAASALDHDPASWNPRRMAARALSLHREVGPRNSFVSSSETWDHTQQTSLRHLADPNGPGAVYPASLLWASICPWKIPAMSLPVGVVAPYLRSPISSSLGAGWSDWAIRFARPAMPGQAIAAGTEKVAIQQVRILESFMMDGE